VDNQLPIIKILDASRYCEAYHCEILYEGPLSALGIRIDDVHQGARSLYALRNEIPFTTKSKKAILFAMRLLNSGNINDMSLKILVQNFVLQIWLSYITG
jgi:hypothetical protein